MCAGKSDHPGSVTLGEFLLWGWIGLVLECSWFGSFLCRNTALPLQRWILPFQASNGEWYKMNDVSVESCDLQTVLEQQAYLLFYTR